MSSVAVATLEDVIDITAAPVKEAVAAHHDRRAHIRLSPAELEWLRQVRLKSGPRVTLVDLSRGGALIDSRLQMRPGTRVTLQLAGQNGSLELASHVLRCHLAELQGGAAIYRGACMFSEPLGVADLRDVEPAPVKDGDSIDRAGGSAPAAPAWQKIVVRYRDRSISRGYTLDFHPSRDMFSLWPSVNALRVERVLVPIARLKAVFFVRDFADATVREAPQRAVVETTPGRRIEVTFADGEVIRGTTLAYRPDGSGFFVVPFDTAGNNERVFVARPAVRHVRFP